MSSENEHLRPADEVPGWSTRSYFLLGLSTYFLWGLFPLYFHRLAPAGALEVIVHRAGWGLIFCLLVLLFTGKLGQLRKIWADRKSFGALLLAGLLVGINWTTYVYAILNQATVDAALGYFINPLVTVALAVVVLRERLSLAQGVALGLGAIAVAVLVIGLGRLPWIALVLAATFGLYSLVKKNVATAVGPLAGMVVETAAVTPLLLGYFGWLWWQGQTSLQRLADAGQPWAGHLALLVGAGILTMIPLIMFAKSAQGLPLGVMGLLQYVAPVMQLIIGVWLFHEQMEPARWAGTFIVWGALIILSIDMWRRARH